MRCVAVATWFLAFLWVAAPCDEVTGGDVFERAYVTDMVNDLISVEIDDTEPVNAFVLLPSLDLTATGASIGARFAVTVNDAYAWDLAGSFEAVPTENLVPWAVGGSDPNKVVTGQEGDASPPVYFTKDYKLSMWGNGQSWIYWEVTITNVQAGALQNVKLYAWMLSPTADYETGAYNTGGAGPLRLFLNGTSGTIGYGPTPTTHPMHYMTSHFSSGNPAGDVDDYIYGDPTWTAPHPGNDLPNTVDATSQPQEMGVQWTIGDMPVGGSATVSFIFAGGADQAAVEAAIEDGIAMVPVELASFRAEVIDEAVQLVWVTLSEKDNLGFHVLRSEDRSAGYARITGCLIPGAGTISEPRHYCYVDGSVVPGRRYFYTLEQRDVAGATSLHGPVVAAVAALSGLRVEVTPNPSAGDLEVALSVPIAGAVDVSVLDVRGREVADLGRTVVEGAIHTVRWAVPDGMAPGLYVVEARMGQMRSAQRWVLLP